MDNSLPKTAQSNGRFRVARNVIPTPDGDIIPRSELSEISGQSSNFRYIHYQTQYNNDILSVVSEERSGPLATAAYLNNTRIPEHKIVFGSPNIFVGSNSDVSQSFMTFRKNNTTYIVEPRQGNMAKYDGVEVSSAGCQQPILSSPDFTTSGTKYIRVIQHCIDFDNNEPVSEYVQFRTDAATTLTIRADGGATNIIPAPEVLPSEVVSPKSSSQSPYFRGTAVYNAGTQDYTITTTDTNITDTAQIGSYVIVRYFFTLAADAGLPENSSAIALRVKSVSPLRLDAQKAKYLTGVREWKTGTAGTAELALLILYGSRNFFTVWASNSPTGNYVYRGSSPSFPYSSISYTFTVDVSSVVLSTVSNNSFFAFSISPNLGDWYDTSSRKLSPNAIYPYGNTPFKGITQYQEQLILWTDDLIWFSDPTLGGTFEQLTTSSFIRVGDTEFGQVTSVCGTQDFLLVSRERKNYFLNGTLPTGNYRVQEMPDAEIGAWSNNAIINVKDSAIMITAVGVFQVLGGGKAIKLSDKIPKNFSRYNSAGINEDVVFSLIGTNYLSDETKDIGLSVAYDEYRELLVFMQKGSNFEGNPCLVLHTATGEFYEWNGLKNEDNKYVTCISFINGKMIVSNYDKSPGALGAKSYLEDTSLDLFYPAYYPIQLFSTWLTAGEPSLEKEVCQIKIFGNIIVADQTLGINIVHFKDWDYVTRITNSKFTPVSSTTYSNKKRLNSDKALALSCGLEIDTSGVSFRIESLEIEFNQIQQGMKR